MTDDSHYIVLTDDYEGYDPKFFCIPKHYEGALECVLVPGGLVHDRIEKLAREISTYFGEEHLIALCVLKGGYKFFTDIVDKLNQYNRLFSQQSIPVSVDFIRLKSYQDDCSTDLIQVIGLDKMENLRNKNVLIVEDVIDTGQTIKQLVEMIKRHEPKAVKVASLLVKRTKVNQYRPDYCGFEVPDKFVVGYAIDYNEHFRDLNHVCVVNDYGKIKFGSSKESK